MFFGNEENILRGKLNSRVDNATTISYRFANSFVSSEYSIIVNVHVRMFQNKNFQTKQGDV